LIRSAETRIFRATTEAWLGQLLLPVIFFCLLTFTAVNFSAMDPLVAGAGLSVVIAISVLQSMLPMLRNSLTVDDRSIQGSFDGRGFQVYRTEVLAAWLTARGGRRYLCLGTRDGTIVLPLRFLDESAVWECIRCCVPPAALEQDAVQRLPDYQTWDTARNEALEDAAPSTVMDHWLLLITGWAGLVFFGSWAADALQQQLYGQVALLAALMAVNVISLARWGITHIGDCTVERVTLFGAFQMPWDDVHRIEVDPFSSVLVFIGDGRRLVIPGPGIWSGKDRKTALLMVLLQAQKRGIPLHRTWLAALRFSRNAQRKARE
jgi:hypothetical protein